MYLKTVRSSSKWTDIDRVSIVNHRLLFGAESPTFGPLIDNANRRQTIISRRISTVPLHLNFQLQLSYTSITASSPDCQNTDPPLTATPPRLEYRANGSLGWTIIEPGELLLICNAYNYYCIWAITDLLHADNFTVISEEQFLAMRDYSASIEGVALSALPIRFRFVQLDHRGGICDCWAVANLTVTPPNGLATELSYVSHFSKIIIIDHLDY
jgi:hypothetical protein